MNSPVQTDSSTGPVRLKKGGNNTAEVKKKRKQFVSCDKCRERRVKCNLNELTDKSKGCSKCASRGLKCTTQSIDARKLFKAATAMQSLTSDSSLTPPFDPNLPSSSSSASILYSQTIARALGKDLIRSFLVKAQFLRDMLTNKQMERLYEDIEVWVSDGRIEHGTEEKARRMPPLSMIACTMGARFTENPLIIGTDLEDMEAVGQKREIACQILLDHALLLIDEHGFQRIPSNEGVMVLNMAIGLLMWRKRIAKDEHVKKDTSQQMLILQNSAQLLQSILDASSTAPEGIHPSTLLGLTLDGDSEVYRLQNVLYNFDRNTMSTKPNWKAKLFKYYPMLPEVNSILTTIPTGMTTVLIGTLITGTAIDIKTEFEHCLHGRQPAEFPSILTQQAYSAWRELQNLMRWGLAVFEETNELGVRKSREGPPRTNMDKRDGEGAHYWGAIVTTITALSLITINKTIQPYGAVCRELQPLAVQSLELTLGACRRCAAEVGGCIDTGDLRGGNQLLIELEHVATFLASIPAAGGAWNYETKQREVMWVVEALHQLGWAWGEFCTSGLKNALGTLQRASNADAGSQSVPVSFSTPTSYQNVAMPSTLPDPAPFDIVSDEPDKWSRDLSAIFGYELADF